MFKQPLLIVSLFCIAITTNAQNADLHRYKDILFSDIAIQKDLSYFSDALPDERKYYLFDLFQPNNDHAAPRPLIIWMHGGGFKFGTKDAKGIRIWCKSFAQRGYVCAALNYRLSKKNPLFHFDELQKSAFYAVQDAKRAIEYFRQHQAEFNIDPDKIILAGNSAGGMIALQAAYSTDAELSKMAGINNAKINKFGIIKVAGVVNFWGAIYDLNWLKNASIPIVSVLGSKDRIVPPTHKSAPLYGAVDIKTKADAFHIPNALKVFDGYSHELQKHFNPLFAGGKGTQKRWLEAGQFAADFLYNSILNK